MTPGWSTFTCRQLVRIGLPLTRVTLEQGILLAHIAAAFGTMLAVAAALG